MDDTVFRSKMYGVMRRAEGAVPAWMVGVIMRMRPMLNDDRRLLMAIDDVHLDVVDREDDARRVLAGWLFRTVDLDLDLVESQGSHNDLDDVWGENDVAWLVGSLCVVEDTAALYVVAILRRWCYTIAKTAGECDVRDEFQTAGQCGIRACQYMIEFGYVAESTLLWDIVAMLTYCEWDDGSAYADLPRVSVDVMRAHPLREVLMSRLGMFFARFHTHVGSPAMFVALEPLLPQTNVAGRMSRWWGAWIQGCADPPHVDWVRLDALLDEALGSKQEPTRLFLVDGRSYDVTRWALRTSAAAQTRVDQGCWENELFDRYAHGQWHDRTHEAYVKRNMLIATLLLGHAKVDGLDWCHDVMDDILDMAPFESVCGE